jgi:hypothetical protein
MGWRGGGRGRSGYWPGRGPFSSLPPWQRPGWLYGYGRGLGLGRGYGLGYYGSGYRYSPYVCQRFPWLPRWWWANPSYGYSWPYPPSPDPQGELDRLQVEKEALAKAIEEMRRHVEEGTTPTTWPQYPQTYYGVPPFMAPSPDQEKTFLEQQSSAIEAQMEDIRKRLEELEREG